MEHQQSHPVEYMNAVNALNSQIHDFTISPSIGSQNLRSGSSTPLSGIPQLNRSSSLLDTFGVQRVQSPLAASISGSNRNPPQTNPVGWGPNQTIQNAGSGLNGVPAPPGMVPSVHQISWQYLDHSNQIQGPFPSEMMDQWFNGGFFNESLQLMPLQSRDPFQFSDRFIVFRDLLSRTGYVNPFHTFDVISSNFQVKSDSLTGMNLATDPLMHQSRLVNTGSTLLPQDTIPDNSNLPSSAIAPLNQNLVSTTIHFNQDLTTKKPSLQSPDLSHSQILQLKHADGSYYRDRTVAVPLSKNVQTIDQFEQSLTGNTTAADFSKSLVIPAAENAVQEALEPSAIDDINSINSATTQPDNLPFNGNKKGQNTEDSLLAASKKSNTRNTSECPKVEPSFKKPNPKSDARDDLLHQLILEEELERKKKEEKRLKKELRSKTDAHSGKTEHSLAKTEEQKSQTDKKSATVSSWNTVVKPIVHKTSLHEIQKRDAEEKKRREADREKKEREAALKLQESLLKEESKKGMAVTSVASWASVSQNRTAVNPPLFGESKSSVTDTYVEEQRKILEDIKKASSAIPMKDSWSTISKKKATPSLSRPQVTPAGSTNNPTVKKKILNGSTISIPTLKKPGFSSPFTGYSGNQSTSARRQFLGWCRSQMKLSQGVKVDSVLEMLLSLPPSMDSAEIISDTIYANSAVMNGRTFANEFLKKRIECEKSLNDPLTWSEALALPEGNSDDWEFQVVGKKKGKKF